MGHLYEVLQNYLTLLCSCPYDPSLLLVIPYIWVSLYCFLFVNIQCQQLPALDLSSQIYSLFTDICTQILFPQ